MIKRPTTITLFALYLLIVFGLSTIGSLYGAISELPPYTRSEWLVRVLPKVIALFAGFAFWRMLRVGAWLWAASIIAGWAMAIGLRTGFFPDLSVALVVSMLIVTGSIWVIYTNWALLRPWNDNRKIEGAL